jgi:F-type H+-transporting ATPase subunit delta
MPTDRSHSRRAAQIYAANLLEAAESTDSVFAAIEQLDNVTRTVLGNVELRNTLTNRSIAVETRKAIAEEIFSGYDVAIVAVLTVAVERGDLMLLPRIFESYISLAEASLGAVIINVITAVPLDDSLRRSIQDKYAAEMDSKIILRECVDKSIVGGIVLSTHGRRIDASVVTQLENARATLAKG